MIQKENNLELILLIKKINGPFDSILENIIKQEIHLRNNDKSLEKLSLLLY